MHNDLVRIRHFIRDHHNLEEFRTLCFDLGVRYDVLGGEGLDAKTRELLLHLGRQRRLDDLLKVLENSLPEPFHQADLSAHPAAVESLYAMLPTFPSAEAAPVPTSYSRRAPRQLALRILAGLSWVVAAIWFWAQPGFEPLLALLSGVAFFLSSFAVDEVKGASASSVQEAAARNRRISQALVEKVRTIWIHGVLDNSLHNVTRIELGLAEVPGAVERPWAMALERPGEEEKPLPQGTKIEEVFRQLGGAMLILGAPGSGKTVTLLALARQLLDRAERSTAQPVPLVFNLSSWAHTRGPLTEWLVKELHLIYGINKKYALGWLQSAPYTLLLDGLDEVAEQHRNECVAAINEFHRENGFTHIAVCSRTGDYERLVERLHLMGAITIRPLSREQVNDYLATGGEPLAAARAAVNADSLLQELAQTPLTLNVIALAYQGRRLDDLASGTLEERRRHLFAAYVQRMFTRRGAVGEQGQEQAIRYLTWLATRMSERSQMVYYIEKMQPDWLGDREQLYRIVTGLVVGLVSGLLVGLVFGLGGELFGALFSGFFGGLAFGLVVGLGGGLIYAMSGESGEIALVEALDFSLKGTVKRILTENIRRRLVVGLGGGLLGGLLGGLVYGLVADFLLGAVSGVIVGFVFGLLVLFGAGLFEMLSFQEVQVRTTPNQGIRLSGRNALLGGLFSGLFGGLVFGLGGALFGILFGGLAFGPGFGLVFGLVFGAVVGLVFGLVVGLAGGFFRYGGATVIKHATLRVFLTHYNYLPLRLVDFLDNMAARVLLRKVGGGYMFIHRMLLEHFADSDV